MTPNAATDAAGSSGRFNTTRWSLIVSSLDAESADGKAREALAQLCRIYWRPIFAFVCRKGHSVPDAQDLTQDFFVLVLKGNLFDAAIMKTSVISPEFRERYLSNPVYTELPDPDMSDIEDALTAPAAIA